VEAPFGADFAADDYVAGDVAGAGAGRLAMNCDGKVGEGAAGDALGGEKAGEADERGGYGRAGL